MALIIEKATATNAKEILDFLNRIGSETDNLSFGAEGLAISVEDEAKYLSKIKNSDDSVMFVAKLNDKIVGNASLNRFSRRMQHRGELSVAVLKDFWGQGIGTTLLNSIIDFSVENQFEVLDLQVRSDNSSAIHLYEKFGFKKIGTHPAFFKINGEKIEFDYMCLELKS